MPTELCCDVKAAKALPGEHDVSLCPCRLSVGALLGLLSSTALSCSVLSLDECRLQALQLVCVSASVS